MNVTGCSRGDDGKIINIEKLDAQVLNGIFHQAQHQFPGFSDWYDDKKCKTVKELNIFCKRERRACMGQVNEMNAGDMNGHIEEGIYCQMEHVE